LHKVISLFFFVIANAEIIADRYRKKVTTIKLNPIDFAFGQEF